MPLPQWIHNRAKHIQAKNPGMPKSESFAIATQQAHATGKSPKEYGTSKGRVEAKQKYDLPKSNYEQSADPKTRSKTAGIDLGLFLGFSDELQKIATDASPKVKLPKLISKPRQTPEISPIQDHIGGMKVNPPPPVTMSSGGL